MTLLRRYYLGCDHCESTQDHTYRSAKQARQEARREGWQRERQADPRYPNHAEMRDACPRCATPKGKKR